MTMNEPRRDGPPPQRGFPLPRGVTRVLFPAAAVFGLVYLFRDQAFGESAPLLLLLLICVGMHFFMHRGHGSASTGDKEDND